MSNQPERAPAEEMASFFDVRAATYDDHMLHNEDLECLYTALAAQIPKTDAPIEILDLGCGTGLELHAVFKRAPNARITGLDVSAGMLDRLQFNHADRAEQLILVHASYVYWDYPTERFDAAISSYSLHHYLPERKTQIYERVCASLKLGGRYVEADYMVTDEIMEDGLQQYRAARAAQANGDYHIDIPFTPEVQRRLLRDAGFAKVTLTLDLTDHAWPAAVLCAERD